MSSDCFLSSVALSDTLPAYSDKCILPQSVLLQIISENQDLPHPLVFVIKNEKHSVYIGVKEFTAPENVCVAPKYIFDILGDGPVSVTLKDSVPKATFLRLKPAQFYPHITNWKFYLESQLSKHYTTVSKHQSFSIYDYLADTVVDLYVEDGNADTMTVIDTDTVLDVVPLNDIMAAQQLGQTADLSYMENIPQLGSEPQDVEVLPFTQTTIPAMFKVDLKQAKSNFSITLHDSSQSGSCNTDMLVGLDKLVKLDCFQYQTMSQDAASATGAKHIDVNIRDDVISNHMLKHSEEDECWLYVVVFAWEHKAHVKITLDSGVTQVEEKHVQTPTMAVCSNCRKEIAKEKLPLHEAFCLRNNVRCACGEVFRLAVPATHWHCEVCDPPAHGESMLSKMKHARLYHEKPYKCTSCNNDREYNSLVALVQEHKANDCPAKLHECMFCHLVLPQGESDYQDRFANMTHHENQCGSKTTECYECGKVLKRKDLNSHLKIHFMDKVELNTEQIDRCSNVNCVNIITGTPSNDLNLCDACYGPLFASVYDPTHSKLQNRIERKYMMQLTKGCGNTWCDNSECVTGNPDKKGALIKDTLGHIHEHLFRRITTPRLPIASENTPTPPHALWFCINESIHIRKELVKRIVNEGVYSESMVLRAVSQQRDEDSARNWLSINGLHV